MLSWGKPIVTTTLPRLLLQADAADVTDVLSLAYQLIVRFRDQLRPLAAQLLPALVARVHGMLGPGWDWTGAAAAAASATAEQVRCSSSILSR